MTAQAPRRPDPLLPPSGGAALFAVIALMSFLATLTLAGAIAATRLAAVWSQGLTSQMTVQIVDADGATAESQVDPALAVLRASPGVAAAEPLSSEESAALLKPWLGDADLSDLGLPVLIAVTLAPGAALDADALRARLAEAAPGATLDDHSRWNDGLAAAGRWLSIGAGAVLALIGAAAAAVVALATRAALQSHREIIDVLHLVGAKPGFIAAEVQRRHLRDGFLAGVAGLLGALGLMGAAWTFGAGAAAPGAFAWTDAAWLALVPFAAGGVSTAVARVAVMRVLGR